MNIQDAFSSNYLKTSDLKGKHVVVTIKEVAMELVGKEEKPVIYFSGKDKGMVLNRTNATTIEEIVGTSETVKWKDQKITLYPTRVDFQGRRVDATRVEIPGPQAVTSASNKDLPPEDDDISF